MKGLSKMIGGFLGFLLAGPGGCLLGILVGHVFDNSLASSLHSDSWGDYTHETHSTAYLSQSDLAPAYQILGLTTGATYTEVKQAYRRSMNRYHPDRLAQKNLSPDQLRQATQKVQRIKEAYEIICRINNFS